MSDSSGGDVVRAEFSGRVVEEARELFQTSYNGNRFQIEPHTDFFFRHTSIGDGDVSLRGTQFAGRIRGRIQTENEYIVSWLTEGRGVTDIEGEPVEQLIGRPAMFVTERPAAFDFDGSRQNLIHFDAGYLERIAEEVERTDGGPLRFDSTARPEGEALRRWSATVATVARVVYSPDTTSILRREADRMVATSLLATFPHSAVEARADVTIPRSGRLRDAIEFMYAHAHEPIRTENIADAAGVSLRTLQSAFRREYGFTAIDYLRRIRLDKVHAELRAGRRGEVSVSDVARRWGFAHLGRFSAAYSSRFGERPSDTLQR